MNRNSYKTAIASDSRKIKDTSYTWSYSPPPPLPIWPPKKAKKKMNSRSTTLFLLPKLDDMVLFKPIVTPCDDRDDFKEPLSAEKTRIATISQHLDRYNRWLAFADASSSSKRMRSAALDMQQTVHDINSTISKMMMEIDRKVLELHDKTDAFVEAVQEGESWQSNGRLLGENVLHVHRTHAHADSKGRSLSRRA